MEKDPAQEPMAPNPDQDNWLGEDAAMEGLSLEELGQTYARLMGADAPASDQPLEPPPDPPKDHPKDAADPEALGQEEPADEGGISPRMIVEAILFVGEPTGRPSSSKDIAALMRGVSAEEVDGWIAELQVIYDAEARPYQIESVAGGYRLQLRPEMRGLSDRFHRTVRQARLSQAAIDVLAVVAYQPGLTRDEVDRLRGKPSAGILSQLVRRQLLRLDRRSEEPRNPRYYTTDRFLAFFNLANLEELPRG